MKSYKFLDVGCKTGKSFKISEQFGYTSSQGLGTELSTIDNPKFTFSNNIKLKELENIFLSLK